ncbi:MAG: SpoIVB peptidase [Oscillospiraceae bacterium]|nr:SpoIVB peptidase [Oscillospiraceae bacterium]
MNYRKISKSSRIFISVALTICVFSQSVPAFAAREKMLVPMGCTIGIQMYTDGVMVVGLSATQNGQAPSPAAVAGILPGDLIKALGEAKIGSAEEFKAEASKLTGEPVSVTIERKGETLQLKIEPNMKSGAAELGIWLRDNVSGIGTMTFYDPQTKMYGGLGHGINDYESGVIMPLGKGSVFRSTVVDIKKGCSGAPGELCGDFSGKSACGSILKNTCFGIFGVLYSDQADSGEAIPVADSDEIELGKATVLTNIEGMKHEEFEIEITRVYRGNSDGRSMMITVKDKRLLEKTGGIVQGMSGSPIIQNGKLIGAVTHVMVNDPTKGFGISIEKMLDEAGDVELGKAA